MLCKVVLIRKHPTPTDEIYFFKPLEKLLNSGILDLEIFEKKFRIHKQRSFNRIHGTHVVISRYIPGPWLKYLRTHSNAHHITYLFDDDIPAARESPNLPRRYRKKLARCANNEFYPMLDLADTLVTTSPYLFERYASRKIFLLEPGLWTSRPDLSESTRSQSSVRIVYFATAMHWSDLEMIAPALRRIHDSFPFVVFDIVVSRKIPRVLANLSRVRFHTPMPWEKYKEFLTDRQADIFLAPKDQSPYNRGKSFIKVLDAALCGAVGVYSTVAPYTGVVRDGVDGVLVRNDPGDWYLALHRLLTNPSEREVLRRRGGELAERIGNPDRLTRFWENHFCGPSGNNRQPPFRPDLPATGAENEALVNR